MSEKQRFSDSRGFTLIELLVVIAIIAILASILFPVFARAREMARRSSCSSNFKQMSLGMFQYAQDYDETMPRFSLSSNGYNGFSGYNGDDGVRWADSIMPYIKSSQVFDCPSGSKKMEMKAGGQSFDITTYSYGFVTPSSDTNPVGVAGRLLSSLEDTAGTLMLVEDGRQDAGAGAETQGRLIPTVGESIDALGGRLNGFRHTNVSESDFNGYAFNAAFADGHVKWVRLPNVWDNGLMRPWTIAAD